MTRRRRMLLALVLTSGIGFAEMAVDSSTVSAQSPSNLVYTVIKGDSISGIAGKLHVRMVDLMAANGLKTTSVILPGQHLVVPPGGTLPSAPAAPAAAPVAALQYTVVSGDSLIGISTKLKVTLNDLLAANKLTKQSVIVRGMRLNVPAGGVLPAVPGALSTTPPASPAVLRYTVKSGDSLSGIAMTLKVTLTVLLAANKLTKQSVIHPGMQLLVPAGGTLPPDTTTSPVAGSHPETQVIANGKVATVLAFARAQLGEPYRFNAAGPNAWDCSGLTMAAYAQVGVSLPHYSAAQSKLGSPVNWKAEAIQPGDLVFLESSPGSGIINHVGIAINATQWIQAPRTGDVVRISTIVTTRIVAVRRYVQGG